MTRLIQRVSGRRSPRVLAPTVTGDGHWIWRTKDQEFELEAFASLDPDIWLWRLYFWTRRTPPRRWLVERGRVAGPAEARAKAQDLLDDGVAIARIRRKHLAGLDWG